MPAKIYPFYVNNSPTLTKSRLPVYNKHSKEILAEVSLADEALIQEAIAGAFEARKKMASLAAYERREILLHCVSGLKARKAVFSEALCMEAGKLLSEAELEVARCIHTFEIAAEEAVRIYGEVLPLDIVERGKGFEGFWKRFPVGVCTFITPFNFPLNLAAHKVAPAIAAGCPFILKPAPLTPLTSLMMGEILAETALPPGGFSIVPCENAVASALVEDSRINQLSFTGSAAVGFSLKAKAVNKKVTLELGGNAACIVEKDADLEYAAERITVGAFFQAGQSCISVQRIMIHADIYESFKQKLVERAKKLKTGDPKDLNTTLGPLISEQAAMRVEEWVESAAKTGAKILCGGKRQGAFFEATLLEDVPLTHALNCEEVFGPVAILIPYQNFDEALALVNDSAYGLQAGVFSNDLNKTLKAWHELEVGGIIVNEIPSWRMDNMPYGGVKKSGIGREGVRFALEEFTEIRLLCIRNQS